MQAQQIIKVSASFSNKTVQNIFLEFESQYPLRFFFKETELPKKTLSISFDNTPIIEAINELLKDSGLKAFLFKDYAVVIGPKALISENFTPRFYDAIKTNQALLDERLETGKIMVGIDNILSPTGIAKIRGEIKDEDSEELVSTCLVDFFELNQKVLSSNQGTFEITVPIGIYKVKITHPLYADLYTEITVKNDGDFTLALSKRIYELETVSILSQENELAESFAGLSRLNVAQIEAIPVFMGDPDPVKGILYLPGVTSAGDGATGFNVRGGNTDENQILLGGNMLFNANHAFGFFGGLNTDAIREVNLFRGDMPAEYGGRLSSVMDIQLKRASTEHFSLKGGIGPINGKLTAEIPLKPQKNSLLLSGRSLYSDWILNRIEVPEIRNSSLFFYDINAHYLHHFNTKNILTGEIYSSQDDFQYTNQFGFDYRSNAVSLHLSSLLGNRVTSSLALSYSSYKSIQKDLNTIHSGFDTGIQYFSFKEKVTFQQSLNVKWNGGLSIIYYQSQSGKIFSLRESSPVNTTTLPNQQAIETAGFLDLALLINQKWKINAGIRTSWFSFLGPGQYYLYQNNQNPLVEEIVDSLLFDKGSNIASYFTPEPRLSLNYQWSSTQSLKLGYSRTAQYIFQLSNFDIPIPTNPWILSNYFLKPQRAHNLSIEFIKNWQQVHWTTSFGSYYRWMTALKDYRDFADLMINRHFETEVFHVNGRAYGLELNLRKNKGILQTNISYTLARVERKTNGLSPERSINDNQWYPTNYDKTHELNIFLNYYLNFRHSIAITFNYATGRPTTAQIGYFDIDGISRIPIYANRNELRIPDYHRLDIAYTIGQSTKRSKQWKSSWTFGLYNVYGRRNAYAVFFNQNFSMPAKANKLSILGSAFPTITYNFNFGKQ